MQTRTGYYIGVDVGTGSARACVIDHNGDIVGLASENIGLWQPEKGYYVRLHDVLPSLFLLFMKSAKMCCVGLGTIDR